MATLVKYFIDTDGQVLAYFPKLRFSWDNYNKEWYKTCYSHIGQHSACCKDYTTYLQPATPEQYRELNGELQQIGYNLKVCKPQRPIYY